jgi:hypothetical protein
MKLLKSFRLKSKRFLFWLHKIKKLLGYTSTKPVFQGKIYYFYTYSYSSLNYIYNEFYKNNKKI